MAKYLQSKIARSRQSLTVTSLYAILIWILSGLVSQGWWWQFGCFALTAYLVLQLNNANALIRVYSRMVSCAFLVLACCANFMFPLLREGIMLLCITAFYLILFSTYQDQDSPGKTFYAFLFFGTATIVYVQVFYLLPVFWILMATNIMSLSWRTWIASLIGIVTPYWLCLGWYLVKGTLPFSKHHLEGLLQFQKPFDYAILTVNQQAIICFLALLALIGTGHCLRQSYLDKIRTRLFYGVFIWMDLLLFALLAIQPQHYHALLQLLLLNTAPLAGHFLALSNNKVSNITFFILIAIALALTADSLWNISSLF